MIYGPTTDGTPATAQTITLGNNGTLPLSVSGVVLSGANAADFAQSNNCSVVATQGYCTIYVIFKPSAVGLETALLVLIDNAPGSRQTIPLSGVGQVPGSVVNGGLIITPSSNSTTINGTVILTANRPVTFALAPGALGTLTTVDTTHAAYTAPSSIPVQGQNGGCMTGPNDSILETAITNAPPDANSATMLSQVGNYVISPEPTYWVNIINDPSQALFTEKYFYGGPGTQQPYFTSMFGREQGQFTTDGNYDHHTRSVLVNNNGVAGSCQWYETYQDIVPESAGLTRTCYDNSSGCTAVSGITYSPLSYNAYQSGTNVAGITTNLTADLAEIKGNAIHHPMTFTMGNGFISSAYRWPANYSGDYGGSNTLPVGARLRLNPAKMLAGGLPAIASYSQYAQNILNAWVNYGIILLDGGDEAAPTFDTDVYEDPAVSTALQTAAANLKLGYFDVVNTDVLKLSNNSLEVNPLNTAGITPVGFAYVTATDSAPVGGIKYSAGTGIALQGVLVGVPNPQLNILAAATSYSYQLPFWVTGTSNQNVTWTVTSGPGSVTSGGLYTVPAASAIATPTAVTLTGTAAADLNATVKQYVELIPFSSDGNFRMVMDSSAQTDSSTPTNFTWWPESGMQTPFLTNSGHDYPSWPALNSQGLEGNIRQYSAQAVDGSGDLHLKFVLPNGNYKTRLLYGFECRNYCGSSTTFTPGWVSPEFINVNGQMDAANYRWGEMVGYAVQTAWDYYAPGQVTTNVLDFWTGPIVPYGKTGAPGWQLSGIEIMPDTSSPHIAIDTGVEGWNYLTGASITQPLVVSSATAQLNAVGWYIGNSVNWAVTSGGGTISSSGLFTAPAAALNPQTIAITGTSTVNNTKTATATLIIPGTGTISLATTPASLTFGSTYDGTISSAQAITVSNTGTAAFNLSGISFTGTNGADFSQTNNCSSIAAGASCPVSVKFTPSIVGAERATLALTGNETASPVTVALSGTGAQGTANGSLGSSTLTFAATQDGNPSSPLTLTLSDSTTASGGIVAPTVTITDTNAADFTQTNTCTSVSPGASCPISVVFTPSMVGAETATLRVAFNNGNSPLIATLNGSGTASRAAISLSPGSLSFPATPGMSNAYTTNATALIRNTGTSNLIIHSVRLTGTNAQYFLQINNCTSEAPGSSCTVAVIFASPSDINTSTAALSISDNATGSPHALPISGTDGWGAQFGMSPNNLMFQSTAVGSTATSASVSQFNTSSGAFAMGPVVFVGANASDFSIGTTNCGSSIPANSSCNFTVNFKPTIAGVESAELSFTNGSGYASPATMSLVGIGH